MIAFLRRLGARGAARRSAAPPRAPRHRPLIAVVALVATVALLGACTEDLDTKAACPSLCPNQDVTLRDTILDAVALDTTLPNYPGKGGEAYLLVASQGTLDTPGWYLAVPLLPRLAGAVAIVAVAGLTERRWLVPFAVVLALPVIWLNGLAVLAAVVPLWQARTVTTAQTAAPATAPRGTAA